MANDIKSIITELERQRAAIDLALEVLQSVVGANGLTVPAVEGKGQGPGSKKRKIRKTRIMSEEGRRRVAEAQRKRWAAKKRADKKLAKKAA